MKFKILMICLGNICRSPLAEEIMRSKISRLKLEHHIIVDSAGTSSHHQGSSPDPRSCLVARNNGLELHHSGRPLVEEDFKLFDLLLVMDQSNLNDVRSRISNPDHYLKIHIITSIDSRDGALDFVPDPYWSGSEAFEKMYQQLDYCCEQWLNKISTNIKI